MGNLSRTRRAAVRLVITGISASVLPLISRAKADEKMSRTEAQYQDTPKGIYCCATCSLFEPPKSCKVVAGEVSEDGWCKAFALAD